MNMDCSSISIGLLPLLILALAASSTTYSAAAAAAAQHDPPKLIILNLLGHDGDKASLAVQPHDLSLAGFGNRTNHWHVFPGHEHVIPDATLLPFSNSYRDLIGGLENLPSLPLGRDPVERAIHALSGHGGRRRGGGAQAGACDTDGDQVRGPAADADQGDRRRGVGER
ncbi:hypothetical protein BAE44_0023035 [Dichanthelium oligosanthes]|uniref:rRNA N-glycosylase n=1 Tax=Dichanthelium oligosanthes TaxID=888268 RepID=A0A1E5UT18_9POAL|nr:hypothetical protein BAE44_0023035 [Dichanthelium oligosanthes]